MNYPSDSGEIINASVSFTSNGQTYSLLKSQKSSGGRAWYKIYYDSTEVYSFAVGSGDWTNEAYRTLTFAIPPTGDLLTWLQANGTKQGGVTLINFTIDGTTYQAEEGMTWEQWCNSSYNTSNGRYFIGNGLLRYGSGYIRGPLSTSTSTNPHGTDYPQANGVYAEFSESGGVVED